MQSFEEFLDDCGWEEKWIEMSRGAFPVLLWCATHNEKITYKELNNYLYKNGYSEKNYTGNSLTFMGHPAGLIGEYMLEIGYSLINSLLINGTTGIPGEGVDNFIGKHLNKREQKKYSAMTNKPKREFLEDYVWSEVYSQDWDRLVKGNKIVPKNFTKISKKKKTKVKRDSKSLKAKLSKYRKGAFANSKGESEEHKKLKDLVIKNINKISALSKYSFKKSDGEKEYTLPSADKIDVVFKSKNGIVGVEVKSTKSDDNDFYRGIYQCVKYKYLLRAEQMENGEFPSAESILVTQRLLNNDLKAIAKRFGVKCFVLKN